jgi:hypothetical protein
VGGIEIRYIENVYWSVIVQYLYVFGWMINVVCTVQCFFVSKYLHYTETCLKWDHFHISWDSVVLSFCCVCVCMRVYTKFSGLSL